MWVSRLLVLNYVSISSACVELCEYLVCLCWNMWVSRLLVLNYVSISSACVELWVSRLLVLNYVSVSSACVELCEYLVSLCWTTWVSPQLVLNYVSVPSTCLEQYEHVIRLSWTIWGSCPLVLNRIFGHVRRYTCRCIDTLNSVHSHVFMSCQKVKIIFVRLWLHLQPYRTMYKLITQGK